MPQKTKNARVVSGICAVIITGIVAVLLGQWGAFAHVPCCAWYVILGIAFAVGYATDT